MTDYTKVVYRGLSLLHQSENDVRDINALLNQLSPQRKFAKTRDDLAGMISERNSTVYIATNPPDWRIIGMATVVRIPKMSGAFCEIHEVVVLNEHRRHGVGKALTMFCIHEAKRLYPDCTFIELTSKSTRVEANPMYLSLGFTLRDTNVYRLVTLPETPNPATPAPDARKVLTGIRTPLDLRTRSLPD